MKEEKGDQIISFHEKQIQRFVENKRPPIEIRDKVDVSYSFKNYVVEIFEIRPAWRNEEKKLIIPIAKSRFIKSRNIWRNYWMRASGKWEPCQPSEEVKDLSEFLKIVDEDKHGCFWG